MIIIPFFLVLVASVVDAFTTPTTKLGGSSQFLGNRIRLVSRPSPTTKTQRSKTTSSSSSLNMFLETGGILGVGAPEVFTILLVGYFVLGPNDLYKLVKEIGKQVQNFRSLGTEATKTFENNMESTLELDEIRKAQRELNDAFSFRRSINVDEDIEEFADITPEAAALASPIRDPNKKTRRKVRIRKRKVVPQVVVEEEEEEEEDEEEEDEDDEEEDEDEEEEYDVINNIPDLDMTSSFNTTTNGKEDDIRAERMSRLTSGQSSWFDEGEKSSWPDENSGNDPFASSSNDNTESNRFAQQMAGGWNKSILDNEDKLGPLAQVMEKIALLEEQKQAADTRLEEEFRLKTELEQKFYAEKRAILEGAAAQVQADAYASNKSSEK